MEIILLNKTCKYHKRVFATELIFCNNPKPQWKNLWLFCRGNQAMLSSWLAYKNMSSCSALFEGHVGIQANRDPRGEERQMVKLSNKPQPQVGMASGRQAGRLSAGADCVWAAAPAQVTDVWWIFNSASSPLSPHLSPLSTRLAQPPPVWKRRLKKRELSPDLLISPGCPGWLRLMTSLGVIIEKSLSLWLVLTFPHHMGILLLQPEGWNCTSVGQKRTCWPTGNKSEDIWFLFTYLIRF